MNFEFSNRNSEILMKKFRGGDRQFKCEIKVL